METKINMQPPLDIWNKVHYLIMLIDEIIDADLKTIGGKDVQKKLQVARNFINDAGVKEWLDTVKKLKEQNVLKT